MEKTKMAMRKWITSNALITSGFDDEVHSEEISGLTQCSRFFLGEKIY